VKRKRESSELSGDEGMFLGDTFSSTLNSSGLSSLPGGNNDLSGSQSSQHLQQQQQQHYGMMGQIGDGQSLVGHPLQQLVSHS
jgi:hypothetical protein